MNFSILRQEFLNLVSILSTPESSANISQNSGLSKNFFEVSQSHSSFAKNDPDRIYKTSESIVGIQRMSFTDLKDRGLNISKDNLKKSNRQNVILGLLKKKKELTIKDITAVIKDCSEKTVQRELNYFISTGLLKRSGVRRWSKYSLA
jgi:Fic family protein